jgi:hypothetical protein
MTGYGEPYEGEKKKGEQTARAKAGKDYDGDGKVESPAKEYRGVVHNAIQKRRGGTPDGQDTSSVKEEFIGEVKSEKDDSDKTIHVMKGKNKVTVNPEAPGTSNGGRGMQIAHYDMGGNSLSESQAKFFTMLQEKAVSQNQQQLAAMAIEYLDGNMPDASDAVKQMAKMGRKELKKFAKTKHKGLPTHKEENECGSEDEKSKMKKTEGETDSREIPTKVNLMKNKLRSMGLKMSYEPEGEDIHEVPLVVAAPLVAGGVALAAKGLGHLMNKAVEAGQKNPNRRLVTGGTVGDLNKARGISNSYQPEGEVIDEAGSARYLQSKALRSGSATLSTPIETGASLRSKVQALKSKDTTPAPAPRPATSTATPTPRPISGVEALKKRMKLGGASSPYLNQSYDPEGNVVSDGYDSRYGRGEMGEQIQEKDEKVEAEFKRARTPHLLSQFRQKHPGSRQPKKERGAKETESEKQRRLTNRQVARAVKHGLTKKEKGESEARAKYDSPRD